MLHPDGFLSQTLPFPPNWNASTKRSVAPSPAASRPSLSHFFSPRLLYLPYESPWLISLFHLMSGPFVSQPPFLFQVWPDLEWNQDSADRPVELLRPLTRSCFHLLVLGRLSLLALPWNLPSFTVESTLSLSCSRSDPPHSRQGPALAHLDSLLLHDLVLWTDGSVPSPFGKGGYDVLANCFLCGTEAAFSFSAGPVCSSFSAEACAVLHALC